MTLELQRVVFPAADRTDLLPLYVAGPPRPERARGRRSHLVPAGERVSFAAYANALPASYWSAWTDVGDVALVLETEGGCEVEVRRSDADGVATTVVSRALATTGAYRVDVPLDGFDDGGWMWFDLVAGERDCVLTSASWVAPEVDADRLARVSIGITTFNRGDSCARLVDTLAHDDLASAVDVLYIVDQGGDRVRARPDFFALRQAWGGRMRVIEQPNLGGSGGFARAQLETLRAGTSAFTLLLDDDVEVDPELLRRMLVFASLTRRPAIVGSQMLSLTQPTRLHATAEQVALDAFAWGPVDPDHRDHDFAVAGLADSPWLHRRVEASYTGWWACLIPVEALREVGLALPLFLKWDDAEYGLRAAAAGIPTVTLAGAGVWHMPWWDKDDTVDWQAYFNQRNRIIAALLHSPRRRGGRLVPSLFAHQLKHLVAMQYATTELRRLAVADVLRGPRTLADELETVLPRVLAARAAFADGQPMDAPALVSGSRPAEAARPGRRGLVGRAAGGVLRHARPRGGDRPAPVLRHDEATWWELAGRDTAVVVAADGGSAVRYRRSRRSFARQGWDNAVTHARLALRWRRLRRKYRAASAKLASPRSWEALFGRVSR